MDHPLFELLLSGAGLTELINAAEELLGNPLAYIDPSQNEPLLSRGYPKEDMEDKAYRRKQISNEEFQKDTDYVNSLSRTGTPQLLVWPHIRRKRLICGSLVHGRHLGGIRLPDIGRPLENLDFDQVKITAQILGMAYMLEEMAQSPEQNFLRDLLKEKLDPALFEKERAAVFGASATEDMVLIWFIPRQMLVYSGNLTRIQDLFQSMNTAMTSMDGGFIVMCPKAQLEANRQALDRSMIDMQLLAALSDRCRTMDQIRSSYNKARAALRFAMKQGISCGLTDFRDWQLQYMLSFVPRAESEKLLQDSPFQQLAAADREQGTDYIRTLEAYLRCHCSIKQTADALCLHKNTVFYRLGKLRDDFGIDPTDPQTAALLQCQAILSQLPD